MMMYQQNPTFQHVHIKYSTKIEAYRFSSGVVTTDNYYIVGSNKRREKEDVTIRKQYTCTYVRNLVFDCSSMT